MIILRIDRRVYLYCIWTLSPSAKLLLFSCVNFGRLRLSAAPGPKDWDNDDDDDVYLKKDYNERVSKNLILHKNADQPKA
jgi:hypothetical protein